MTDVTVTQEDRNAAVRILEGGGRDYDAKEVRLGYADHSPLVQAFARHRQSSTEEVERLREALRVVAPMVDYLPHPHCITASDAIRTALAGVKPHE